ncbi:MAG: restriction endonuclease [Acidobacteria bacterium]|nr:restriction endonuclease [Acidobacteriota bacterium]MBI3422128.1 restriction endonuclease [Acidobacteriota bacterium]
MKVPYTQQFTPEQTPLKKLLPILRQHTKKNNSGDLRKAIASAFFSDKNTPQKLAGNTLIALRTYGIIDQNNAATDFGEQLLSFQSNPDEVHKTLAKHILLNLDGVVIVETLKEMERAALKIELKSLPNELRQRGFEVSSNSSDLSGLLGWLRQAKVLDGYRVNPGEYQSLIGTSAATLEATKNLNANQFLFLRAMLALNVQNWTPYNTILKHAEELYAGQTRYSWKDAIKTVLVPLQEAGLIEIRKKVKQDTKTPEGRGGKATDVKPTGKFETEFAEPILDILYRSAGFTAIREIRSKSLDDIVADIKQGIDQHKSGKALEYLAIRLCQMLDLNFMGLRETDSDVAGGGEVDAMMHSTRLIYSRWQVQCKVGNITTEVVAKEKGMQEVTLANVILIVSTGSVTSGALTYRRKIVSKSNLNIIYIDGTALNRILKDNSALIEILRQQAQEALNLKPMPLELKGAPPSQESKPDRSSGSGSGENEATILSNQQVLFEPAYSTEKGRMYCGDALEVLPALIAQGFRAKLIMTSPPFALVKKKEYSNEDSDSYVQWFEQFIPHFKQILEPGGSLVVDIGGSWIKGLPAKSIYQFKLLVKLCESGFYLAQDFYHYNPARLPSPAEWVTVRRMRVKDAMNSVWWLTLDPFVDADNRRVLVPYSESMKTLLEKGYKPGLRPSGHDISDKFQRDNGGAIPPNLFQFSNTESNSHYLRRCKEESIKPHPARFPHALPEFFIKFLTSPDDLVLDIFAGSNVTGATAESLKRQWIGIELDPNYVAASKFRFESTTLPLSKEKAQKEQEKKKVPKTKLLQPRSPLLFD